MTLPEFLSSVDSYKSSFAADYRKAMRRDSVTWPREMDEDEWFDQLLTHIGISF
jgi:cytochrome b involved in lipid metabolism